MVEGGMKKNDEEEGEKMVENDQGERVGRRRKREKKSQKIFLNALKICVVLVL